jgi:hypothetical protein
MPINKLNFLKIVLNLGALYYIIGALVHFFGITLFPFFDSNLYTPYQDSVIALTAIIFALLLIVVAKNPIKNIDILNLVIICATLASIFSIAIIWKVDFASLGAPAKKLQTIVEGVLGFIWVGLLLWLYPKKTTP